MSPVLSTTIDDAVVPRFPHGVRFREDKARGRFILVGPERIFNADDVATEILKRCDGRKSFGEILFELTEVFTAEASVIRPDVESFLGDLRDKGMVEL
ncbi:pyrroloquinoline quinone biosynthesis protein PqqD [Aureimonas sp. Leaf460]|uniref:pyrroloquinoline quinone biosynthesis peptide chaperone PqqD n=1 Tax=Aureimonas sp. Leaf460 TaxID=1736384 RepID=UPI0006FCABFB|nr:MULTISPECIES: pyrroloquinoline quinone biosynthesis peptide chaperone PqqD [unclassified Aureimonas]KQT66220.1 pyrroloquinoline quinone biosynthesis protein PqqD [Aureimonas sp. Leaf427]KQT72409.1 pyrroloquinoline quinone biosynthesis protein PqqD [Aureimonas sp. Leaf460]